MARTIYEGGAWRFLSAMAIAALALLAGCERSSPTAPAPSGESGPSTASVGPVHFEYDAGITGAEKATLEAAATIATDYFRKHFGRTMQGPVTVPVRNADGPFAVSGAGGATVVTVYVQHRDWRIHGPWKRTKMMVHELYEILQDEVGWSPWGGWLQEGSAEFVADAAAIEAGMATVDEVRQCQIGIYFYLNGPLAVSLERSFDPGADPANARFVMAWLAWDRLLDGPGGAARIATYWKSGFQPAFGRTEASFYQEFGAFRRALQPPRSNACASLDWR